MQTASFNPNNHDAAAILEQRRDESARMENVAAAAFHSILFEPDDPGIKPGKIEPPEFFHDLNLDQIVDAITAGWDEYNLKPFFHTSLKQLSTILYRQEIMRDLEKESLFKSIRTFSEQIRMMRHHLSAGKKWSYKYSQERWFLDAVGVYCNAVVALTRELKQTPVISRGLCGFAKFLLEYIESAQFKILWNDVQKTMAGLLAIRYAVRIKGGSVTVRPDRSRVDYTTVIEDTFEKFKQGAVKDYRVKSTTLPGMNHVEAAILDRVALLHPEAFHVLDSFCAKHGDFLDDTIARFDREIQFYIAFLEHAKKFQRAGLKFCYPRVSQTDKEICSRDGFDLALAGKLIKEGKRVVCNDFVLRAAERIFVVTGPNQGGKTTFARTFGQLHYLASLGCPVPGSEARLFLFDRLFTHFEHEEDITTLHGKLQDDLVRVHRILQSAMPNSLVIINEIFSSTSLKDAVQLGRKILNHLSQLDALSVCVTFMDELAAFNEKTVSIVAGVVPEDPTERTLKLERRQADGLAYALAIAEKYGLTYHRMKARLKS